MSPLEPRDWVGRTLHGRLHLTSVVGRGGMGAVFVATDTASGRRVAVKVLLDEDPRSRARFEQEARATMRLSHPNVVRVHEHVPARGDEPAAIVMELVAGESLRARLTRDKALPIPEAVAIARGVLEALAAAHDAGIVHRDVKPANVLLTAEGGVKVVDFGIAKPLLDPEAVRTTVGSVLGTPHYLAPEQIRCEPPDARADLFAVGICLHEMIAGERPFTGSAGDVVTAILTDAPPPLSASRPDVPRSVEAAVLRALAKDRAERWPSARAMLAALSSSPRGEERATPVGSLARFVVVGGATVAIGGAVLAVLAVLAGLASRRPPAPARAPDAGLASLPWPPDDAATAPAVAPDAGDAPTSPPERDELDGGPEDAAGAPAPPSSASTRAVRGFTVLSPRRSYCHKIEAPGKWIGRPLCPSLEAPKCFCMGSGQMCPEPWTIDATTHQVSCAQPLQSFGGPGKLTGDACTGWALEYTLGARGRVYERQGKLSCSYCLEGPPTVASPGTACRGYTTDGAPRAGVWVAE